MSLVNAETGELIAECTPDEARELTDRICTGLGICWELVLEAYRTRAWAALGHGSWDAYCSAEFGKFHLRLPSEERDETIASLRSAGLSIRAIAATGVASKATVEKAIKASGVIKEDTSTTGTDGKKYDAIHRAKAKPQHTPVDPGKCTEGFDCPATPGPDGLCAWHRGRKAANEAAEPGQGSALDPAPVPDTSTAERRPQAAPVDGTGGPAAPGATPGLDDAPAAVSEPPADEQPEPNQHSAPVAVNPSLIDVWDLAELLDLNPVDLAAVATADQIATLDDAADWLHRFFAARKEMAA